MVAKSILYKNRLSFCIMGIATLMCLLCSCGNSHHDVSATKSEGKESVSVSIEHQGFRLQISTNPDEDIDIPNPAKVSGIAEVILYQSTEDIDMENLRGSEKSDDTGDIEEGKDPVTDLSFLGIKEKVYITNFAVGTIGEKEPEEVEVNYEDQEKTSIQGNVLVLTLNKKYAGEDSEWNMAYLAVLDYWNGKSYLMQTGLYENTLDQLNLCDLSGDGQDEMIVSGIENNGMEWQVYQLLDGEWNEIKSDFYYEDDTDGHATNYIADAFKAKLITDDEIKVSCKDVGFEKVISIQELEKYRTEYPALDVTGKSGEIYGYHYFQNINEKKGICIPLDVVVYYGCVCGRLKVYLKYNRDDGKLDIYQVKFKKVRE